MNEISFFENQVSNKTKKGLLRAIGGFAAIQRQQELHLKLVDAGKDARIKAAKAAIAEKRRKKALITNPFL